MLQSADDENILEAAGHEKMSVDDAAKIAGAEKRPLAGTGDERAERRRAVGGLVSVPERHAVARDPDLADLAVLPNVECHRIDDPDSHGAGAGAGADPPVAWLTPFGSM